MDINNLKSIEQKNQVDLKPSNFETLKLSVKRNKHRIYASALLNTVSNLALSQPLITVSVALPIIVKSVFIGALFVVTHEALKILSKEFFDCNDSVINFLVASSVAAVLFLDLKNSVNSFVELQIEFKWAKALLSESDNLTVAKSIALSLLTLIPSTQFINNDEQENKNKI